VLDEGVVVQRGTHDALIRDRDGRYAQLLDVAAQAALEPAHVA